MAESSETQMADSFDTESFHGPPSLNRGSRYRKTMATKVSKLTGQLNNQEKIAEAAIAAADTLRNSKEGEPSSGDTQPPDRVLERTDNVPVSTTSPQAQSALFSAVSNLLSKIASLRHNTRMRGMPAPLLEVTPSISTADSLSALSSFSTPVVQRLMGKLALNASTYSGIPHGHLPGNEIAEDEGDMYSLSHRTIPGCPGVHWFLQVSFEILPEQDSQSTLLLGLVSLVEILSSVIDGFELHPLDPESTLPFLILGSQSSKTAVLAFKYCGVKNKRIVWNSAGGPSRPQVNLQRHNDDEEFIPSKLVQAVIRVRGKENVKVACDSISWDMSDSGLTFCGTSQVKQL
jgi:hypothetical protein